MFASLISGIRSVIRAGPPNSEEARDKARVLCRYSVRCSTRSDGQPFPASVVDVSRTGLRLEGVAALSKGDRLWVSYAEASEDRGDACIGPVEVEVIWARKRAHDGVRLSGVRYLEDQLEGTWVQLLLREVGLAQDNPAFRKRKYIRMATALRAELCDPQQEKLAEGKVANLSVGGTLVQSPTAIPENTMVLVTISPYNKFPVFSVPAQVLHTRYDAKDKQHFLSLAFVEVDAKQFKTLKQFVFNLVKGRSLG